MLFHPLRSLLITGCARPSPPPASAPRTPPVSVRSVSRDNGLTMEFADDCWPTPLHEDFLQPQVRYLLSVVSRSWSLSAAGSDKPSLPLVIALGLTISFASVIISCEKNLINFYFSAQSQYLVTHRCSDIEKKFGALSTSNCQSIIDVAVGLKFWRYRIIACFFK